LLTIVGLFIVWQTWVFFRQPRKAAGGLASMEAVAELEN
jgi:hypothetical protein